MHVIFNVIRVKKDCLDKFIAGVREHARHSNDEPGCLRYEVLQDTEDPQVVCLHEVFHDEVAFREHLTKDYYKTWMESSRNWRQKRGRIRHVLDYVYRRADE